LVLALTAFTAVGAGPSSRQAEPVLELNVVRSYRSTSSQTVVDVFCRVPLLLVNPIGTTGGGAYRFAIAVRDSSGLELAKQNWLTPVRAELLRTRGASTAEHMTFAARPGSYTVEVTVTDSASGRIARTQQVIQAFGRPPAASDLLLGSDIRPAAGSADTVPKGNEIERGSLFIVTSGQPVLTPQSSKLAYYLELYPAHAESIKVAGRVLMESGTQVVATAPVAVAIDSGGGIADGVIDLAGLPPGTYRYEVTATGPDSQITRSATFGMAGFGTVAAAAAMAEAGEWPAGLSEAQLDEAYQPLIYLMSSDEQGVYSSLSVEGKRNWLRQFWAKRDPTPGTARNEERDRFYAAINEANRQFREGGASAIPGWRTDRGRIFIKYGPPDEVLERKVQSGGTNPYEIWKYTRNRNLKYVFMDLTRFGNYTLIYTNDVNERSRPDWQDLLGPEGLKDVEQN
jgi:GWxTD domain-containing protein